MSRHLVDPEPAVRHDSSMPARRLVAAIPKPTSEAMQNVRCEVRLVPGLQGAKRAWVGVELHVWPGAFHAFGSSDCHISREARRTARTAIKRALWGDKA